MVPSQVSSRRRSSSGPGSLSPPFVCTLALEGRVDGWEFSKDALVVLLGVHSLG